MEDIINNMNALFQQVIKYYPMKDLQNTRLEWNALLNEAKEKLKNGKVST
jgi:hypothetical protein